MESNETLGHYLESWSRDQTQTNVINTLLKITEFIEKEYEVYIKMNPDPFDDRHPCRTKPSCALGHSLKFLFKYENFVNKLFNDYLLNRDCKDLQVVACRLTIAILPGLDTAVVFDNTEMLINRLFERAREADEPLRSYAIGLLAASMEVTDIAVQNKEKNIELVPIILKRLKTLTEERRKQQNEEQTGAQNHVDIYQVHSENLEHATKRRRISSPSNDCSNSSWAEMETYMIGSCKIYPLTNEISQRFIFQYLHVIGEYHEYLSFFFEHNILDMILETIDLNRNHDVRLAFECLKCLSSLLCHKKFALEFVNHNGIQALMRIYRQSLAASSVACCLSSIAVHDDVMEKICLLPRNIFEELVSYSLFLTERSHYSCRLNTMVFFGLAFSYRVFLESFDRQDGLRKILNEISMIDLFTNEPNYSEEEICLKRQYAKHICYTLRRYFDIHLIIKTRSLIESAMTTHKEFYGNARLVNANLPPFKPIHYDYNHLMEHVEVMLNLSNIRYQWEPVDKLMNYGGPKLLLQYISISIDWNYTGKADAVKNALDILVSCSVMPKFQQSFTEHINYDSDARVAGMRIILAAAVGEIINDPDCQRSALNVIINCVCGPIHRLPSSNAKLPSRDANVIKRKHYRSCEDILSKMWNCVRFNDGIMLLINLLMIKTPITDADLIRALSCKALCGLARSENVRQVMCKLPLFTNGQIQTLMKEPILQDKRAEHLKFYKHCLELIELVTGSPATDSLDASMRNLNKAEVITQTKIVFNEKELLKLIHNHLLEKGLDKTAQMLAEEAELLESQNQFKNSLKFSTPPKQFTPRISRQISLTSTSSIQSNHSPLIKSGSTNSTNTNTTNFSTMATSTNSPSNSNIQLKVPIRINRVNKNKQQQQPAQNAMNNQRKHSFHSLNTPTGTKQVRSKPQQMMTDTVSSCSLTNMQSNSKISLDSIVKEYLRKQHALCKNPVVTCPPFDLFKPHRCPEPMNRLMAPLNITSRLIRREYYPPYGGFYGSKFNRKFIYSRFRSFRALRCMESTTFQSIAFANNTNKLFAGSESGELQVFNIQTGDIESTYTPYDSLVTYVEPSRDNKLILTTTEWDRPNSILWDIDNNNFEEKLSFQYNNHVEFSKTSQDKVLGTQEHTAHLFDLNTSNLVRTFFYESYSNHYMRNMATFHPNDYLILNDGVLWDVRTDLPLHKFDKLNDTINGIFHPNGQEIISSSEIWDLKTYKLMKTVPALSQSHIKFNSKGDVIYAVYEEDNRDSLDDRVTFTSSFRTFDGRDYSSIATIDVKRSINALAVDIDDRYLALVEQARDSNTLYPQDIVRIYEVGRSREEDDEEGMDDDEAESDAEDESEDDEDDEHIDFVMTDSESDFEGGSGNDEEDDDDDDSIDDDDDDDDDGSDSDNYYIYQLNSRHRND